MNSSTTFNNFNARPSTVVSNWKSSAHKTSGRIGHIGPTATPRPRWRFLRRRYGTFNPSARQSRCTRFLFTRRPSRRSCLYARPPPPSRTLRRKRAEPCPQLGFLIRRCRRVEALRRAMLTDQRACSAFGNPEPFPQHATGVAAAVRGQKFPSANSLSMSISSA